MQDIRFFLRARDEDLARAWQREFKDLPVFEAALGDIFDREADAVVCPANSFGDMTGGIDRIFSNRFGPGLQAWLQAIVRDQHDGELLVGQALIVPTGDARLPWLISAPTMRVPLKVADTANVYLAFRAVLRAVREHNKTSAAPIRSVLCPGMGTGTGEVPANVCARQMRAAYNNIVLGAPRHANLNDALVEHYRLIRSEE